MVWGSFRLCRDNHVGFQAGTSVHVRCGVEQYLPSLLARQFGLDQKIPVPPFWSFNKNFDARDIIAFVDSVVRLEHDMQTRLKEFENVPPFVEIAYRKRKRFVLLAEWEWSAREMLLTEPPIALSPIARSRKKDRYIDRKCAVRVEDSP